MICHTVGCCGSDGLIRTVSCPPRHSRHAPVLVNTPCRLPPSVIPGFRNGSGTVVLGESAEDSTVTRGCHPLTQSSFDTETGRLSRAEA